MLFLSMKYNFIWIQGCSYLSFFCNLIFCEWTFYSSWNISIYIYISLFVVIVRVKLKDTRVVWQRKRQDTNQFPIFWNIMSSGSGKKKLKNIMKMYCQNQSHFYETIVSVEIPSAYNFQVQNTAFISN